MRSHRALGGLMSFGVLLLPFMACADSQLASGTHGPSTATAHVRFRIVIPSVLALDVADTTRTEGAHTVTVTSNSHTVAMGATLGNSAGATGRLVLTAAARRGIAQEASCTPAPPQQAKSNKDADSVKRFCTVSMP